MPTCPKCFKHNPGEAAFCGFCGASIPVPTADAAKKTVFGYVAEEQAPGVSDDAPTAPIPPLQARKPAAAPVPAPVAPAPAPAPVAPAPAPVAPAPPPAPAAIQPGVTVAGRFQVESALETLPVGTVWNATDTKDGQPVALLLVGATAFPSPLDLERARREMRQLQKVDSPNVLRIIDHGKHQDQLYVATEPVAASSLTTILGANKLALDNAHHLVKQIGAALAEAQKVGVIHRDLAPHNVLVAPDGSVKLRGFGIAPPIKRHVFGTPEYVSPEQSAGRPVDQRSNIYSIGALMYHMLAGAPPFAGSAEELLEHHQKTEPPQLPAELGVAPRAAKLIAKALSKSSSSRHLTLRQFLREIDTIAAAGSPAPAPPPKAPRSFETPLHGVTALTGGARPPSAEVLAVSASEDDARAGTEPSLATQQAVSPPQSAAAAGMAATVLSQAPAAQSAAEADDARAKTYPPVTPDSGGVVGGEMHNGERVSLRQSTQHEAVERAEGAQNAPAQSASGAEAGAQQPVPNKQPPPGAGKGGFRETMWFFKGEMESAMAEEGGEQSAIEEENPDLQSKYADDGSIEDNTEAARLSLRTGNTQAMQAVNVPDGKLPGSKMKDAEFIKEMGYKHTRIGIYIGLGVVAAGLVGLVLWLVLR